MSRLIEIHWVNVEEVSSNSFRYCLIMTHKHSSTDWQIVPGYIEPINQYTDFRVIEQVRIARELGREVKKSKIMAIGFYPTYGYTTDPEFLTKF